MILDYQKMQEDYARCYADKSRCIFIEQYLSTFNASAGKMTPFILFPRQKVFLNNIAKYKANVAIKHRQCGITTISSAWICAQIVFASNESPENVLVIANKLEQASELLYKIRDFLLQVPRWYWGDEYFSLDPKSEKNTKDIFVKNSKSYLELFNGCKVYARASSANAARGISSVSCLIFDEAAFIEDGTATYSSAVAATAAVPHAKIIMVSTPYGHDELYYQTYKQAVAHENNYIATEFKWYQDLRYNKFLKWYRKKKDSTEKEWFEEPILDETGTVPYDEEHWRDMERKGWTPDSPWYNDMCKSFNNDVQKIAQELDVSFQGSADNVVEPSAIEMQQTLNVREPLSEMADPMTKDTWFWKPPIDGHRYICACLPQGEKVITQRGEVNVENVQENDLLLTKEGEWTEIKHRKYRNVEDEDIVKIYPYNFIDGITFTHNHPIWSSKENISKRKYVNSKYIGYVYQHEFDFHDASEISRNDWLEIPNIYNKTINKDILINIGKKYFQDQYKIIFSKDFWWYCGMWLAEGYCATKSNRIITVHNIKEIDIFKHIEDFASTLLNRKANKWERTNNSMMVYFENKNLKSFLLNEFNKYAQFKQIPEWVKFLPNEFKCNLFYGYYQGDGWIYKNVISTASISKKLCNDFQDILLSLGLVCSVKLGKKEGEREIIKGKISSCKKSYHLQLTQHSTELLFKLLLGGNCENNNIKKTIYFSEDLSKIYVKVKKVENFKYSGKVYNFETVSDSHTFCCRGIATHNCDPSRGVSADRTSIQIIDMDGEDENGFPIIEQVMEYNGKKLGDDIGALCFQYATMYNNAYMVFDATGGQADAAILAMMNLGYKNFYYEDANQKTYMLQNHQFSQSFNDRLPGFHFQGNRYPVLAGFAGMVRNNEFKIRSVRVINELETWIFKGDSGRIDHMDGSHDDNICALAMGLFVMKYSLNKIQNVQQKDKAILNAYFMNSNTPRNDSRSSYSMQPSNSLPFYNNKTMSDKYKNINGSFLWLLSGKI